MVGYVIIACEILFWVLVIAGLVARYIFKMKKLGALLLICTPLVDLLLLIVTVIDLKNGAIATTVHGIAAIYIGVSIAFGHQMIKWADEHFAARFANGEKPVKRKKYGKEYAKSERSGWYRHLLAWCIGSAFLAGIIFFINNREQTEALYGTLRLWSIVLAADFLISFSYTIFPKKDPRSN
ncbi:2TM domain-containing protein [Oceanobacillus sp. 143]|uniref:2TM domain-containing protein n=1 Tax=Oceanobacillus zhaokaii TaxID=2052660 RepID=A0A345PD71_9BACI|nr:2TM domain-containing protein [Oceanobacillus zhaokaii]AXI07951.1 hypothetical protein CUC15_02690 [Oceanobacillus zhaokaii]QGS67994.1 2TM domain-containing protein [Oceanobacillus sp. 143]